VLTAEIDGRSQRAVVAEVAAALRVLQVDGTDLVQSYPETELPPFCSGIVLAPWPNRIRDGIWEQDGVRHQLDITEVDRANAIHGLLEHTAYRVVERDESSITLSADVHPQRGYPFALETLVTYELTGQGIRVTHGIRNVGAADAPVAVGTHPFLRVGDVPTEDLEVVIDAPTHIEVDPVRLNPTGLQTPVEGTRYDLRDGVRVRDAKLDDAWADARVVDGVTRHGVQAPDGRRTEIWADGEFTYWQVFVTPWYPVADGHVWAVARVERVGLITLEPGSEWSGTWGIDLHD
jgi:aldose 1-epimerase